MFECFLWFSRLCGRTFCYTVREVESTMQIWGEWRKIWLLELGAHFQGSPVWLCFCDLAHAVPYASCPYSLPDLTSGLVKITSNVHSSGMPFLTNHIRPNPKMLWTTCVICTNLYYFTSLFQFLQYMLDCPLIVSPLRANKMLYFSLSSFLSTVPDISWIFRIIY